MNVLFTNWSAEHPLGSTMAVSNTGSAGILPASSIPELEHAGKMLALQWRFVVPICIQFWRSRLQKFNARNSFHNKLSALLVASAAICFALSARADLALSDSTNPDTLVLADGQTSAPIFVATDDDRAVLRAANDLADDFARVTGTRPLINPSSATGNLRVIAGTIGKNKLIAELTSQGKLDTNGVTGGWESYVLQVVSDPLPGVAKALVIAGSDRRGTIFGVYHLSEMIGVSPWYWWADVPVQPKKFIALRGDRFVQNPPAVKYRGIFLNDEDWGLRPWAAKTLEPETGNIGPKTYAKVFELLLRLHANYLWPAMHPGTTEFNHFATNREIADAYGIVMGSSHCEQMLRDNVSEWDEQAFGDYNFVTNPDGVLKYWEQRVRENGKYENVYTVGMRGIHDSGMPGGGTEREKAARLQTIIAGQRDLLARDVNRDVAAVPQIFCPYKEVLPLYRLMTNLPADITLVWPDDNYGYVRQFSSPSERARNGGAGVYYHVSYYGAPRDYLWLCSTPPALIAEEMTKAFDYGADKVWVLNVGDLKPAELDIEFFLKLAWNPRAWNGTNTYRLLQPQFTRDFGPEAAPELTSIMAEYYRLNFQRKPEHIAFRTNTLFTAPEAAQRLAAWRQLSARAEAAGKQLPPVSQDAFFELVGYPVLAAAAINEKYLAASPDAAKEMDRLTEAYNALAGGKWRGIMSDNPRNQVDLGLPKTLVGHASSLPESSSPAPNAELAETNHQIVMLAADASDFVAGKDAQWRRITGLGYGGEAVSVYPTTVAVRATPEKILAESPCLQFKITVQTPGDWRVTVRALPTFSVETGKPQRYAIAFDDAPPQIVSLPLSQDERNRQWQENVLRNAALATSTHTLAAAGLHTLKLWMVDPGIVLDAVAAQTGPEQPLGYVWTPEVRPSPELSR